MREIGQLSPMATLLPMRSGWGIRGRKSAKLGFSPKKSRLWGEWLFAVRIDFTVHTAYNVVIIDNEPPRGKPRGIFNVGLYWIGGSFERKFIIPSGLIPNTSLFCFISAAAERRGIKPDFLINSREDLFMVTENLFQEIKTLSPSQQESVYSFVYLLKHPDYLHSSEQESIEPFANEREALDFANDYAKSILYEAR
jgi:hypothetical protein